MKLKLKFEDSQLILIAVGYTLVILGFLISAGILLGGCR